MRISIVVIFLLGLVGLHQAFAQAFPYQDSATGNWGLMDETEQQLPAIYDSVTALPGLYEGDFLLWKGDAVYAAASYRGKEGLALLSDRPFYQPEILREGEAVVLRAQPGGDRFILQPDYGTRKGKKVFLPLPPLQDLRVYGEGFWLKSAKGEAIMGVEALLANQFDWMADVEVFHCPEEGDYFCAVQTDKKGRTSIGDLYGTSPWTIRDYKSLGNPCQNDLFWVTLEKGQAGLCFPDGTLMETGLYDVEVDEDMREDSLLSALSLLPCYHTDLEGQRWYGVVESPDGVSSEAAFSAEAFDIALHQWRRLPSPGEEMWDFEPGSSFVLYAAGVPEGYIVTDPKGKQSLLFDSYDGGFYRTDFPVHGVAPDQLAYKARWHQYIVATRKGDLLYHGVLNSEGRTVIPPIYESLEFLPLLNGESFAYRATLKGVTTWLDEDGNVLE